MASGFDILSISITVIIGLFAIIQATKYNRESEILNNDTKDMLSKVRETSKSNLSFNKNIYLTNLFTIVSLRSLIYKSESVASRTDTIVFRKTYVFYEYNCDEVKKIIPTLSFIMAKFSDSIYLFLDSDEEKIEIDLDSEINNNNVTDFIKACDVLFEYGILIYLHNW